MKKFVLTVILLSCICLTGNGMTNNQATIGKIEESLYGFKYDNETTLSR